MNKKNAIPKYLNNNFPDYATQSIYIAKTCVNTFGHREGIYHAIHKEFRLVVQEEFP
jgi:hypothetical protein